MKNLGILIGRFQPFHLGHDFLVQEALQHCDALMLIVGSSHRARSIKNPWTFEERCTMIRDVHPHAPLHFAAIPDYFYNEKAWFEAVHFAVDTKFPEAHKILFGHNKDETSYYLQKFTNWEVRECPNFEDINATEIRSSFLLKRHIPSMQLPQSVNTYLQQFQNSSTYLFLHDEARFIDDYRKSWCLAPYPPTFATVDSLVICKEHILLIERGHAPGKGLLALPGGFLEVHEWLRDGIIRELKEETHIALSDTELRNALRQIEHYDYPGRSNIGRVITHAGLFILENDTYPDIQAGDDAFRANWHPLNHLFDMQDQFHDDHYQIIRHMLNKNGLI